MKIGFAIASTVAAAMMTVPTAATARQAQPNDYTMLCWEINPRTGYGQCLERRLDGSSSWYWYDADGNWGEGHHPGAT